MTISTTTIKNSYSGNGSTTTFNYTFKITDQDDIDVIIRSSSGTETTKTITTHYTVTGVGNSGGGTIVFTSGNIPASGETVVLRRSTPLTQGVDLIENDPLPANTLEDALDKLTSINQELQEQLNRSLKVSRTATLNVPEITADASTRAGKLIQKNAADTIKKVTLELGGKGGNIVFEDSYPDAVRDGVRSIMSNTGQSCDAPTRMLVQRSIYDRAVKEAVDEANKIKVDVASKKGDHIGPLVSKVQYDKVINLINEGIKEGATLAAGGPDLPNGLNKGYFVKPTIFTDVNNDMKIAREEIFGPVLSIIPFDTEEEAIKITNDTSYGLGNYLQTEDKEKAKRVARKVRAGTVYINGQGAETGAPFGGFKQSGNGREGGLWGFTEYLEVKAITGWN